MKKFFTLLSAALIGTAGMFAADWYLVGGNYGWSDNAAYKFTPSADNADIQTLEVESLSGEIKIKEANTWSTSMSTNGSKLQEGVLYKTGTDGQNINVDGTITDATITIDTAARTILVTGAAKENEYSEIYLIGDFNGTWSETLTNRPLTLKDGTTNTYTGTYTLTAETSYFKMKAGTLIYGTGTGDVAVEPGVTYNAAQSGNAFSIGAGEYEFMFVLDKNADTGELTIRKIGGEDPDPQPAECPWYLVGGVNNWSENADWRFECTDNANVFTLSVAEIEGTFKIRKGDEFATDVWADSFGSNGSAIEVGVPFNAVKNGSDLKVDGKITDATLTINTADYTILLEGTSVENNYDVIYLVGDFGTGWNEQLTSYPLNPVEGVENTFEGSYRLTAATSYVKLKAGSIIYGLDGIDAEVTDGTSEYTPVAGGEKAFALPAGEYTFVINLEKNANQAQLNITAVIGKTYPETLYVIGNINGGGFAPDNVTALVNEGDGIYSGSIDFTGLPYSYFQFAETPGIDGSDWDSVNSCLRLGAEEADMTLSIGESVSLTSNDYSWKLLPGRYSLRVSLEDNTVTVTGLEEALVWAIHGCFDGETWNTYVMTETDGLWTTTVTPSAANGSFLFKTMIGENAYGWYKSAEATTITESATKGNITAEGTENFNYELKAGRQYIFSLNPATEEFTVTFTSGIEGIEVGDDENAEYFDLRGLRVDKPANGLYIVRKGNTTFKTFLK